MEDNGEKIAEFIKLNSAGHKVEAICNWTQKCFRRGETVAIHVDNQDMGENVDKSLWTFSDMVFIPHTLSYDAEPPVMEPVIIYVSDEALGEADVLFETAPVDPCDGCAAFSRVIDFAEIYDDELRRKSRKRFKYLQDAGYRMRFIE